jgi:hypothetical protein
VQNGKHEGTWCPNAGNKQKKENKKFPVVVYIPKPYSQNYIPMEKEKFGKKRFCQKIEILTVANCGRKTPTVGGFKKHSGSRIPDKYHTTRGSVESYIPDRTTTTTSRGSAVSHIPDRERTATTTTRCSVV